jgi:hypothetical protein
MKVTVSVCLLSFLWAQEGQPGHQSADPAAMTGMVKARNSQIPASTDVAQSLITQMGEQIDLLWSFAVATCGGVFALFIQIALHNRDPAKTQIAFRSNWTLLMGVVFEAVSLVCGYVARGSVVALTPAIFRYEMSSIESWTEAEFPGSSMLHSSAFLQTLFFGVGLCFLAAFAVNNRGFLRGEACASKTG